MSANEPGKARSPGPTYQELLDTDTHEVPAVLRLEAPRFYTDADLTVERYTSREFHDREVEKVWLKVWQFACREEQIPEIGDHIIYDIAHYSFIVVRIAADEIKAYFNSCLHRGRRICDYGGRSQELRCPYHGFAWNLDGSLLHVPASWDFPHVEAEQFGLPEAQVGTWAGFVFINPDPEADSLQDFLGEMPEHFEHLELEDRYIQGHVMKTLDCNWKIAQEAFSEAYHANTTHPQTLPYLGDVNSQYDVFGNFARAITPGGVASPLLEWEPTEQEIINYMMDTRVDEPPGLVVPEGETARATSADNARERWRAVMGDAADNLCDAEYIDNIYYTLFPNFHPWGGMNRIVYRFRPNGDNHRSSLMEVILLAPFSGERPPPAAITELQPGDDWTNAPELGLLAKVFNQDTHNMPRVQLGLEGASKPGITLGNYQETKIRHVHTMIDEYMDRD
jgi:phenylpropionate dioxygenase-like ring-hydroxylating dioxygenase large terminal subunit